MFKLIGAMVVYGFALYGVVLAAERLGALLDRAGQPTTSACDDARH